jgi:hypothetical protein
LEKIRVSRLKDFIALAKEGQHIEASIDLKKLIVIPKVHQAENERETEMYILLGEYSFKVEGEVKKVSKTYMYGISEESTKLTLREMHIANERLKTDYKRLRKANIIIERKYFQ